MKRFALLLILCLAGCDDIHREKVVEKWPNYTTKLLTDEKGNRYSVTRNWSNYEVHEVNQ